MQFQGFEVVLQRRRVVSGTRIEVAQAQKRVGEFRPAGGEGMKFLDGFSQQPGLFECLGQVVPRLPVVRLEHAIALLREEAIPPDVQAKLDRRGGLTEGLTVGAPS
jgi:hypothetical protein